MHISQGRGRKMRIEEEDEEEEEGARTNIITKLSENKKAIQFVVKYIR